MSSNVCRLLYRDGYATMGIFDQTSKKNWSGTVEHEEQRPIVGPIQSNAKQSIHYWENGTKCLSRRAKICSACRRVNAVTCVWHRHARQLKTVSTCDDDSRKQFARQKYANQKISACCRRQTVYCYLSSERLHRWVTLFCCVYNIMSTELFGRTRMVIN